MPVFKFQYVQLQVRARVRSTVQELLSGVQVSQEAWARRGLKGMSAVTVKGDVGG